MPRSSTMILAGWPSVAKPALLMAGLVAGGLVLRGLDLQALRAPGGWERFLLLATLACAVGLPRQVVAFAAGYGFGAWGGTGLALLAALLGCVVDFVWARVVARDWVRRRLSGRLARLDGALAAHPFAATLGLRLLPVGNNLLLNLAAGVSAVAPGPFLVASLLGYLPQTMVFALLGGGTRVGHGAQVAVGVALFAASAAMGVVLLRRRPGREAVA